MSNCNALRRIPSEGIGAAYERKERTPPVEARGSCVCERRYRVSGHTPIAASWGSKRAVPAREQKVEARGATVRERKVEARGATVRERKSKRAVPPRERGKVDRTTLREGALRGNAVRCIFGGFWMAPGGPTSRVCGVSNAAWM